MTREIRHPGTPRPFRLLPLILALAVLSVSGRIAGYAGIASAEEQPESTPTPAPAEPAAAEPAAKEPAAAEVRPAGPAPAATPLADLPEEPVPEGISGFTPRSAEIAEELGLPRSEVEILQKLQERRAELEERDRALAQQEATLSAAEARVAARIQELEALKSRIEALTKAEEDERKAKIRAMVKRMETMKPKDAARIADEMGLEELVPVMEAMSERKSAPILAAMDTAKAEVLVRSLLARPDLPQTPATQ